MAGVWGEGGGGGEGAIRAPHRPAGPQAERGGGGGRRGEGGGGGGGWGGEEDHRRREHGEGRPGVLAHHGEPEAGEESGVVDPAGGPRELLRPPERRVVHRQAEEAERVPALDSAV